jgi:D-alanine-D-alanine ligase-like ATP-grasp enzyme
MRELDPVGVLYQVTSPPIMDDVVKPLKPGGYSDSGADLAFALRSAGISVITPVVPPSPLNDFEWVFPDTESGIEVALQAGARILWANTVLFAGHPVAKLPATIRIVGQHAGTVQRYDDKWVTRALLEQNGLPVPKALLVGADVRADSYCLEELTPPFLVDQGLTFPLILKPVRGRGSQGVVRIHDAGELRREADLLCQATFSDAQGIHPLYGSRFIVEEYLPGEEITVTVMPPGGYDFAGETRSMSQHWALPVIRRFHHQNGIAPYSGVVAVMENSAALSLAEAEQTEIRSIVAACCRAAQLIAARAPVRIDCRQRDDGHFYIFDLNLKPNMTGPGRPGRDGQDSLTAMAARSMGWSFPQLVRNIAAQAWALS